MANKPDSNAGLWSAKEAAAYLGKSERALRHAYKRWNVPRMRFGGQIKFTKESLDQWIKKNTVTA